MQRIQTRRTPFRALALAAAGVLMAAGFAVTAPAHAAQEELIVNGGFENGTASWFSNNGNAADGATLAPTTDAFTGSGAIRATQRKTTGSGPMQDLSGKLQAGQTYTVKARVKYDNPTSPATKQFFVTMHYGGGTYTNLGSATPSRGEWGYVNATFTIPAAQSVATTRLFIETPWTSAENAAAAPATHLLDFTVDDVSLVGAAPPAPPSKTIEVVGKLPGEHNPLMGHKFGADGYGFVHDGRVYMYMTNDTQGYAPDSNTGISPQINYGAINQITLISSDDLVNWVDHGEIQVAGPNGIAPFTGNSWAPGVESKVVNGKEKFFLYYANGGGSSNVVTGDSPLGPWTSERTSTLINSSTPGAQGVNWLFDPAPLVDDDGKQYLFFGGGPASTSFPAEERFNNPKNIRVIELGDDMISTRGTAAVVDAPVAFEAAQVFKRGEKYYLSYSSHFGGNDFGGNQPRVPGYPGGGEIGYMISDDPMSWPKEAYAGVMFPNQSQFFGAGTGGNNHQSAFEYEGKYYFSYHAPTLNKRINGNTTQGYRSAHLQELTFKVDGTVDQVVGDYAGVEQVRDFDPFRTFEAETLGWTKGIATAKIDGGSPEFGTSAPNLVVTDIDNGDWTGLSSVAFGETGAAKVTAKVKPLQSGGKIDVRAGSATGRILGTIDVTGAAGQWTELSADLAGATATQDVYFTFSGPSGDLFEIDTYAFTEAEAAPPLDIVATASVRCIAGKAYVAVQVTNNDDAAVSAELTSTFGAKSVASIAPGKVASHVFTTRQASLSAGGVVVTATATVDGQQVQSKVDAAYPAHSCG